MKLSLYAATVCAMLAGALAGCSRPQPTAQLVQDPVAAEVRLPVSAATVMGRVVETDWYLVIRSAQKVKPLVIWVSSENQCKASANEFNIKAVDPAKQTAPAARCAQGRELPGLLGS